MKGKRYTTDLQRTKGWLVFFRQHNMKLPDGWRGLNSSHSIFAPALPLRDNPSGTTSTTRRQ
jgi:hypothetical protein